MFRARRAPGSNLRIRVRRKRWPRWCGARPDGWPARGWPGCGRQYAVRRNGPARAADRAAARKAGCDFQPVNAEEAMALSCSPMYTMDFSSKEPFCLYGPRAPNLSSRVAPFVTKDLASIAITPHHDPRRWRNRFDLIDRGVKALRLPQEVTHNQNAHRIQRHKREGESQKGPRKTPPRLALRESIEEK